MAVEAARIKVSATVEMSSSQAGYKDIGNFSWGETNDQLVEANARKYRIADGVVDQAVDLAGVETCRMLAVRTDKTLLLKLNGTEEVVVKPLPGASYGYLFLSTEITSLTVSNDGLSGETATVIIGTAGDPLS